MKATFLKVFSGVLACTIAAGTLAGCGGNSGVYDNESDILAFSSQALDGVFSPFFSTAAADGNIAGMTQLGMLSNDENGSVSYGEDEACVVLDMEQNTTGSGEDQTTEYKFVLKNNVRFSNGSYLSMKDVLFNLYVYLDPSYTGSTTIYSTDIVGLQEYRTQASDENEQKSFMDQFETAARTRIDQLLDAYDVIYEEHDDNVESEAAFKQYLTQLHASQPSAYPHVEEDFDKLCELFKEELNTDYSNSLDAAKDTVFVNDKGEEKKGLLTTDVEMFLYNEGYITWNKKANGGEGELTYDADTKEEVLKWDQARAVQFVYEVNIPDNLDQVAQYWLTAGNLFTFITNQELENYYKTHDRQYKNISGIKFANQNEPVTVNGTSYAVPVYVDDAHTQVQEGYNEVLSITIKKVDPKAIWNFAFTVAPLYYYSDAAHIASFDYTENFGLDYGSQSFLQDVVGAPAKNGVPVGAGPYAASKQGGGIENIKEGDFFSLNTVYYERNPYYVLGAPKIKRITFQVVPESRMTDSLYAGDLDYVEPNAKTETFNEVNGKRNEGIGSKEVMTAGYGYIGINAGKVPNLKVRQAIMHCINVQETVNYYGTHASVLYRSMTKANWVYTKALTDKTAYYPYINGPIPEDLEVVNPDYKEYVEGLGKKPGERLTDEEQEAFIRGLIEDQGYSENASGVYTKGNDTLKYRFTIVGSESDHPAFVALNHARELLNKWGFNVDVKTDINGLQRLSSGSLTVWAAAWGSTIDPDMYQVYHKDSTATSVLNWGYKQIKLNPTRYSEETEIIDELSELIDAGRETTDEGERARIYSEALDLVMKLAVELPTYQRNDLFVYNANKIDESSFYQTPTPYKGLTSDLHTISLKVS